MRIQATLAAILLPLAVLGAPTPDDSAELAQAIPLVNGETPLDRREASLEELSKRSNVSCKIVNSDSANVNCRSGPGLSYSVVGYVSTGNTYTFSCYKTGSCYENNCTWDRVALQGGGYCYVNGYYTSSACSAAALGKC